jgi:hypothetical protein
MLHMCVYMYSRFIKNHLIQILEDGPFISEVVLSHHSRDLFMLVAVQASCPACSVFRFGTCVWI